MDDEFAKVLRILLESRQVVSRQEDRRMAPNPQHIHMATFSTGLHAPEIASSSDQLTDRTNGFRPKFLPLDQLINAIDNCQQSVFANCHRHTRRSSAILSIMAKLSCKFFALIGRPAAG